ncbi:helix-turn-helix transcriptional regulator [uncultured Methylobacterium sp.]|uniref:helix-turn-helix transcriptional regulator n=1 Tax=uncultured Methylobacterium sp. TaxID=157278 RepID=UPI002634855B|nr:helix-turn-helix transcriptional regulator [uncultured Methylobacterium sp.]
MSLQDRRRETIWFPQNFFRHRIASLRQIDEVNASGGIAVSFYRTGTDAAEIEIEGTQTASLSFWSTRSSSGFLTVPKFNADLLTVRFVQSGRMVRRDSGREHLGSGGYAMLVAFEEMRNEEASPDFAAVSGTISRASLMASYEALEGAPRGTFPQLEPVAPTDTTPMRALHLSFQALQARLRLAEIQGDLFYTLLEEVLSYQLLTAWPGRKPHRDARRVSRHSHHLGRALDFIDGHLSRPLRLSDIASAAGISVRSLQLSFQAELGRTPTQVIAERRLDAAHRDLAGGSDDAVGAVARRWGFSHMGDFGRRYRERFGCTPTQTRRGRGS